MAANRDVINRQADLDCAAVERSLAIIRTAREEINGWHAVTADPDARAALADAVDNLHDVEGDLRGSTADMAAAKGDAA